MLYEKKQDLDRLWCRLMECLDSLEAQWGALPVDKLDEDDLEGLEYKLAVLDNLVGLAKEWRLRLLTSMKVAIEARRKLDILLDSPDGRSNADPPRSTTPVGSSAENVEVSEMAIMFKGLKVTDVATEVDEMVVIFKDLLKENAITDVGEMVERFERLWTENGESTLLDAGLNDVTGRLRRLGTAVASARTKHEG